MRVVSVATGIACLLAAGASWSAYDGTCSSISDVSDLPPRHWCEVPGSNLRQVEKKPQEYPDWNGTSSAQYDSFQRVMGVRGLTAAWNSGAFDTSRNCQLMFGGGHNDYGGNEIYAFCLDDLSWQRLSDPTVFPSRHPEFQNDDGTPISRHTYAGLAYIAKHDRFFAYDGSPDHGPGACGTKGTWTFDLAERFGSAKYSPSQWELRSGDGEPSRACNNASAYDPVTGKVIFKSLTGTHTYSFSTDSWTQNSNHGRLSNSVMLVVDPNQHVLVELGGGDTAIWDIESGFAGGVVSTSGAKSMEEAHHPGVAYDQSLGRVLAWQGGTSTYTFDVDSRQWQELPAASGNLVNPGSVSGSGGVFGKFGYSPSLNVYVYVDNVNDNVVLYRAGEGTGLEVPRPPILSQ